MVKVFDSRSSDSIALALRTGSRIQRMRGEAKVEGEVCADAELTSVIGEKSLIGSYGNFAYKLGDVVCVV